MDIVNEIISKYQRKKDVVIAKMFGSQALKINDKVFMIIMKDSIVFRMHPDDIPKAVSIKGAGYFDAHKNGHLMKTWVQYSTKIVTRECLEVAERSFQYVKKMSKNII